MNETNNIIKTNEDLKKAFIGILKDLRQITKGFQKLTDIQKGEISEKVKKNVAIKQEKYKQKIVEKQKIDREKKVLKYLKDKHEKGNEDSLLSNILGFAKIFLLTFGAAGLISIIGKTEMGKLLGSLIKSITESFISVGKDLLSILGTAFKESSDHIVKAVKAIFSGISDFFGFISGALTGANGYRQLDLANILKSFFDNVVVKGFHLLIEVFQLAAKVFTKIFQDNSESIKTGFINLMTSVFDTITSIIKTVITTLYSDAGKGQLTGVFESIKKIFVNLWELLKAAWVGEFKDAKGNTTTFGNIILKYFGIWAGLQLGIAALNITMFKFGAAMAGFFDEIDSANSLKCCCNNMANNILDVAEEIEKPKRRRPGSYQEKMEERGRTSRGEKPQRIPQKTPSKIEIPERIPSGTRGKVGKPGVGSVIGAGCSMACDLAERIVEASKKGVTKVAEVLSKSKNVVIQAGKTGWDWLSSGAKKIWGAVTDFGEKVAQKAVNLGKSVVNFVIDKFKNYSKYIVAMVKDSKIGKKVVELAVKRLGPAIERLFAKLALAVTTGVATGGVMAVVLGVLAAYDMAMLAYGLYELFFVEPPEGGGLYKEIKQMVDDWWKTQTEPSKEAPPAVLPCSPLAKPAAAPAPATKPVVASPASSAPPVSASFTGMAGSTKTSVTQSAPASASAPPSSSSPVPMSANGMAPGPAPTAVPTQSAAASAASDVSKAQVVGGATADLARSMKPGDVTFTKHAAGLDVLAQNIKAILPNFGLFTAFNDKFHQAKHPNSRHAKGLAMDFTIRGSKADYATAANQVAGHLQKQGFVFGKDFLVVDEANVGGLGGGRNQYTTGDHIHVQFQSEAAATRYRSMFPTQQLSQFSRSDDEQQLAQYADVKGRGTLAAGDFTGANMIGGNTLNQAMQQTNEDMNELKDIMLDMISQNLMGNSGGMTFLTNNNVNIVNQKGSTNKKFTDPDVAEKIFRKAFAL